MGHPSLDIHRILWLPGLFFLLIAIPRQSTVQPATIQFKSFELVTAIDWSADGSLISVAAGNSIHLYKADDWQELGAFDSKSFTTDLAFSPDGSWLAAVGHDGKIRVWRINPVSDGNNWLGEPVYVIDGHPKGVNSVTFNPESDRLASGGNDAVARFWDLTTGKKVGEVIGGTYAVPAVVFHPMQDILAVLNGGVVRLRELPSGRISGTFKSGNPGYSLAFSPDGKWVVCGDTENTIRIWEVEQAFRTGKETYPDPVLTLHHSGKERHYSALVWAVVFSPNGKWIASAGGDGEINLWDAVSGTLLKSFHGHVGGATSLAFSPDGNTLLSGGLDAAVRVWELDQP
jgi:WD40 repeat protein